MIKTMTMANCFRKIIFRFSITKGKWPLPVQENPDHMGENGCQKRIIHPKKHRKPRGKSLSKMCTRFSFFRFFFYFDFFRFLDLVDFFRFFFRFFKKVYEIFSSDLPLVGNSHFCRWGNSILFSVDQCNMRRAGLAFWAFGHCPKRPS